MQTRCSPTLFALVNSWLRSSASCEVCLLPILSLLIMTSTRSSPGCLLTQGTARIASSYTIIYTTIITYTETTTVIPTTTILAYPNHGSTNWQPSVVLGYSEGTTPAHTIMGICSRTPRAVQGMQKCSDAEPIFIGSWHFRLLASHTFSDYSLRSSSSQEHPDLIECLQHCMEASLGLDRPPCKGANFYLRGLTNEPWYFILSMTNITSIVPVGETRAFGSLME